MQFSLYVHKGGLKQHAFITAYIYAVLDATAAYSLTGAFSSRRFLLEREKESAEIFGIHNKGGVPHASAIMLSLSGRAPAMRQLVSIASAICLSQWLTH